MIQIKIATIKFTWENSNLAIKLKLSGNIFPSNTPVAMENATQIER